MSTNSNKLRAKRRRDRRILAQLLERPSPARELGASAAAYLQTFGGDGYTLDDFLDYARAQLNAEWTIKEDEP